MRPISFTTLLCLAAALVNAAPSESVEARSPSKGSYTDSGIFYDKLGVQHGTWTDLIYYTDNGDGSGSWVDYGNYTYDGKPSTWSHSGTWGKGEGHSPWWWGPHP